MNEKTLEASQNENEDRFGTEVQLPVRESVKSNCEEELAGTQREKEETGAEWRKACLPPSSSIAFLEKLLKDRRNAGKARTVTFGEWSPIYFSFFCSNLLLSWIRSASLSRRLFFDNSGIGFGQLWWATCVVFIWILLVFRSVSNFSVSVGGRGDSTQAHCAPQRMYHWECRSSQSSTHHSG